ncbi:MAG: CoA ester lyase [Hyphomicrobiaceae bacterium]
MRSLLFVPGDSERKQSKALSFGADALILDLEDSVAPDRKAAAREMTRGFLADMLAQPSRPLLYVRINAMDTQWWQADVEAVMKARPDGIMLPKSRSGEDVHTLSVTLDHAEMESGATRGATRILPIATEVAVSLLNMPSYVGASARLSGLTWGAEDLSANVGSSTAREADGTFTSPYRLARDLCLFTAVAADVAPIDTVYAAVRDLAGFERECATSARDGFTAKMAVHPDQVAIINRVFSPAPTEVERAKAIVQVFDSARETGVAVLDGQMLDRPHLIKAERLLARARAAGLA